MVQDDLRMRYNTTGDYPRHQGNYCEDREEHLGHLLGN